MWSWIVKYFFPIRLKSVREARKMSQDTLALHVSVNQRTISNWEKGKVEPSLAKIIDLAYWLKIDINYLLCLDDKTFEFLVHYIIFKNHDSIPEEKYKILELQETIKQIPYISNQPYWTTR